MRISSYLLCKRFNSFWLKHIVGSYNPWKHQHVHHKYNGGKFSKKTPLFLIQGHEWGSSLMNLKLSRITINDLIIPHQNTSKAKYGSIKINHKIICTLIQSQTREKLNRPFNSWKFLSQTSNYWNLTFFYIILVNMAEITRIP